MAEPHAADNALVLEGVHQVHVQNSWDSLVKNGPPVVPDLLNVARQALRVEIAQGIVVRLRGGRRRVLGHPGVVGRRMGRDLGRLARAVVRDRGVDLRRGRAGGRGSTDGSLARARGRGALRGLGREAAWCRPLRVLLLERRLL